MPLVTAIDVGKSYGPVDLFSHISLSIPHRARVGLVGPNGVGKTTLLRILIGLEEPSRGEVQKARSLRIGYLPQEAGMDARGTLWEQCLEAFEDLLALQDEMSRLEGEMSDPQHAETALETYSHIQARFDHLGGYTYEQRIRQTLTGLGFSEADERRPMQQLSGGQRTRALLAKLLLSSPDLLLMDEPTNHLDIAAIEWLESYLHDWDGAVLLISHDRYFLDQVVTSIWEMTPAMELYRGNYSAYILQRAERYLHRLEEYQAQQEFVGKEEDYIRRNIAGQNTRQAQGRRKRLERMLAEARLTPPHDSRRLHITLQPVLRSGDLVLRTSNLQVGYADEGRPLFSTPDLILLRGECAAILGPNGAGKTTFLKTLLDQIPPYQGELTLGASLKIGYFAQAHEGLHPQLTLMEEIQGVAPNMRPAETRDYLAKFLFTGDDVFKEVSVLSGGERGRLALACLALQGANLLLLDEPTNHLDLPAQEVLQAILADYKGTILLVSHDRYLIDALATQIWDVNPAAGTLQVFTGAYSEYKEFKAAQSAVTAQPGARPKADVPRPAVASGLSKMEIRKRKQRLEAVEGEIAKMEAQLATITRQLENQENDLQRIHRLGQEYSRLQQDLEKKMDDWTTLSEEQI